MAERENVERRGGVSRVVLEILLSLADAERHGYGVIKEVDERTGGEVVLRPGTLYRAVSRLLADGWIEESDLRPDPAEDDERRRYYRLTVEGRRVARAEARRMERVVRSAYGKALLEGPSESAPEGTGHA